jgi:hypothetical protein
VTALQQRRFLFTALQIINEENTGTSGQGSKPFATTLLDSLRMSV